NPRREPEDRRPLLQIEVDIVLRQEEAPGEDSQQEEREQRQRQQRRLQGAELDDAKRLPERAAKRLLEGRTLVGAGYGGQEHESGVLGWPQRSREMRDHREGEKSRG